MSAVASYLVALRTNGRLTQEDAADLGGVSSKTVRRWEAGETEPKMSELALYIEALGGSAHKALDYLLGNEPAIGTPEEPPGVIAARHRLASLPPELIQMLAPIAEQMIAQRRLPGK